MQRGYKIQPNRHLEMLNWAVYTIVIVNILLLAFNYDQSAIIVAGIWLLLYLIPLTFLHLRYLSLDKSKILIFENDKIIIEDKGREIFQAQIDKVKVTKTTTRESLSLAVLPWENGKYFYYSIEYGDKCFIVTSCLGQIDEFESRANRKINMYPYPHSGK